MKLVEKRYAMKKLIFVALAVSGLVSAQSAWPTDVKLVTLSPNKVVSVTGKFETGALIPDLTWAANSAMACFPATQNANFKGKHVMYAVRLPPKSILTVTLTPKNANQQTSIWGYQTGGTDYRVPPKIQSSVNCEAEHTWDRPRAGKMQDHTRSIKFQNPTANTYNVLIGATGPEAVTEGEFSLAFALKQ